MNTIKAEVGDRGKYKLEFSGCTLTLSLCGDCNNTILEIWDLTKQNYNTLVDFFKLVVEISK